MSKKKYQKKIFTNKDYIINSRTDPVEYIKNRVKNFKLNNIN